MQGTKIILEVCIKQFVKAFLDPTPNPDPKRAVWIQSIESKYWQNIPIQVDPEPDSQADTSIYIYIYIHL